MSHPDPLFDPDNAYDDDDFFRDDLDELRGREVEYDDYDESMDGDHDSAMTSCGWGTDEDYGYYGDYDDFHGDDGYYDDGE